MRKYLIASRAGVEVGEYEGRTEAEALLAMHRDAGYGPDQVWLTSDGDGLDFADKKIMDLCGDTFDWDIEAVDD